MPQTPTHCHLVSQYLEDTDPFLLTLPNELNQTREVNPEFHPHQQCHPPHRHHHRSQHLYIIYCVPDAIRILTDVKGAPIQ